MFSSQWNKQVLTVRCPVCKRSAGHFCRDANGKCVPMSHRERRQEAMRLSWGVALKKSA